MVKLKGVFCFLLLCFSVILQAQVFIADKPALKKALTDTSFLRQPGLHFFAMGDWGRNGADHQIQVAKAMTRMTRRVTPAFIISTGDNIYPSGVASEWDPLWRYSFEDIYTDFALQCDWYPVLGNHDYKTNPDAQVKYTGISRRWKMPARYYSKLISIPSDTASKVLLVFIDTNPFIPEFYSNTEYGPNVKTQDTTAQKEWIIKELSNPSPVIKWKIVVGHHPMYTGGSRTEGYDTRAIRGTLEPLLTKYKADVYLSGHEHSLQHIFNGGSLHHFISGAASEKTKAVLVNGSKLSASEYGFMVFSVFRDRLLVSTIADNGKIIYAYSIIH